ncbi:MAG: hypothetical protein EPO41_03840 [Reyranella sp.]|uniref:hypothetical protein n=1 Tax=Reyranella sp. TaxID=1929291 RepID=UPI001215055B|nr:hypothetical protein [Reyranella sp.]TAJ97133.1 MAG: hypothetical protein EPO41_03840 [Reyranella sp.]
MIKLIALCGAPGAGKTEVQAYLQKHYGVIPVDDGHPLRDFAVRHLGLTHSDVSTQDGKASLRAFPGGRHMFVREALGELGNRIEEVFGPDAIPEMAYNWVIRNANRGWASNECYCFGSVRRQQGRFYKSKGAVVVEIKRPGHEPVNEFDRYDASLADFTINNDSSIEALNARIEFHFGPMLRQHAH